MQPTAKPIGVFDSGVGGLTVVAALERYLPDQPILYLGDTARLPYGTKSPQTVERYTRRNLEFLVGRGVKAVVVACNTASALALERIDSELPLWGVIEPGAEEAAAVSEGRVGVIATESTVRSSAYRRALEARRPELQVLTRECPLLVPLVEEGWHEDPIAEAICRRYLDPLVEAGIDTLVLGCTHYPLLKPMLQRIVGPETRLVDSAEAVARQVAADLKWLGLLEQGNDPGESHFCVTDAGERFSRIARQFLGRDEVSLELVEVL
jgi:glutamate racemase